MLTGEGTSIIKCWPVSTVSLSRNRKCWTNGWYWWKRQSNGITGRSVKKWNCLLFPKLWVPVYRCGCRKELCCATVWRDFCGKYRRNTVTGKSLPHISGMWICIRLPDITRNTEKIVFRWLRLLRKVKSLCWNRWTVLTIARFINSSPVLIKICHCVLLNSVRCIVTSRAESCMVWPGYVDLRRTMLTYSVRPISWKKSLKK